MGKFHRNTSVALKSHFTPGPGAYKEGDTKETAPRYGFGSSSREKEYSRRGTPGPGSYEHQEILGNEAP